MDNLGIVKKKITLQKAKEYLEMIFRHKEIRIIESEGEVYFEYDEHPLDREPGDKFKRLRSW